jgi:hypothetical protein
MARNYKELQAKMDPESLRDNKRRVREELKRLALRDLRGTKQLPADRGLRIEEVLSVDAGLSRFETIPSL